MPPTSRCRHVVRSTATARPGRRRQHPPARSSSTMVALRPRAVKDEHPYHQPIRLREGELDSACSRCSEACTNGRWSHRARRTSLRTPGEAPKIRRPVVQRRSTIVVGRLTTHSSTRPITSSSEQWTPLAATAPLTCGPPQSPRPSGGWWNLTGHAHPVGGRTASMPSAQGGASLYPPFEGSGAAIPGRD